MLSVTKYFRDFFKQTGLHVDVMGLSYTKTDLFVCLVSGATWVKQNVSVSKEGLSTIMFLKMIEAKIKLELHF